MPETTTLKKVTVVFCAVVVSTLIGATVVVFTNRWIRGTFAGWMQ